MVLLDHGGRPRHESRIMTPPADVSVLVEHLWVQQRHAPIRDWRIVPDASPYVIASIADASAGESHDPQARDNRDQGQREHEIERRRAPRRLRVMLVGPRSRVTAIDVRGRVVTVGIRLRPGVLTALVRVSASELVDTAVPVDIAFPRRVLSGLELSADAPIAHLCDEMIRLVRRTAADRSVARSGSDRGDRGDRTAGEIARIVSAQSRVRGATIALGVSERTLRDRVRYEIGLSPKRTLRILRLHRALLLARTPGLSWADIAGMSGYADQAHFTRECRVLLGETPTQWRARGTADSFKTVDTVPV